MPRHFKSRHNLWQYLYYIRIRSPPIDLSLIEEDSESARQSLEDGGFQGHKILHSPFTAPLVP